MYSVSIRNIEKSAVPRMKPATLAPVTVLMRKIENDISGSCRRSSTATNDASSTAAVAKRPIVRADDQPKSFAFVIASTVSDRPEVTSTAPAASKLLAHASRLSERRNGVTTMAQLYAANAHEFRGIWGGVRGEQIWRLLHGEDLPYFENQEGQSIDRKSVV